MNNPYLSSAQLLRDAFQNNHPDLQDPEIRAQIVDQAATWLENVGRNANMSPRLAAAVYASIWGDTPASPEEEQRRRSAIFDAFARAIGFNADPDGTPL